MFNQMNRFGLSAVAASVLFLTPMNSEANAQPATPAKEQASAPQLDQSLYFDLDFPGGTLDQYIKAIRKAHGSANVMLSEDAKTVRIPAVKLNGVTLDAAVKLLRGQTLTRDDKSYSINFERVDLGRWHEYAFSISAYPFETAADRLKKKQGDSKTDQADAKTRSNVWSLRDLIDSGMKMDDVLGAVNAALKTIDQPYKIHLHEPTMLLIVRGTDEQLTLVEQIVSAMRNDANNSAASVFGISDRIDAMQTAIIKAEAAMRVAEKRLKNASETVTHAQRDYGELSEDMAKSVATGYEENLSKLELAVIKAQGELQIAQDKAEKLRNRLDRLQSAKAKAVKRD